MNLRFFLSTHEAAQLLHLHPGTLRRLIRDGRIRSVRVGRKHLIPVDQFQRLTDGEDGGALPGDPT